MDELLIYEHIGQVLTMSGVVKKRGRHVTQQDLGVIEQASIVVDTEADKILWIGRDVDLPTEYKKIINRYSPESLVWMPELVDCHTHLLHTGSRHHEFGLRAEGKSYQEIAAAGGGILFTLQATRKTSLADLVQRGLEELERFQKYGVGAIEVKSGYGLTLESELRLLEAVEVMQDRTSVTLVPTFLAGHAVPPEFKGRPDDFVDVICREWIPTVAKSKLAKYFDAFVEEGFFNVKQARRMFETALEFGLKIKCHSDQFNDLGGTALAIELGAQSVDHLDHVSDENAARLGKSDTVAVLLPGASLFTRTPYAPARKLIDHGARVALATNFNPGTCTSRNLPLMTTIACAQMQMTVPEALAAVTYNAAAALGLDNLLGSLDVGRPFRVCTLRADSYEVLPYCFGELE